MKGLSRKLSGFLFAVLMFGVSAPAQAVTPINFEGPKITYDKQLLGIGDFATYNFMGSDKLDAAVPSSIHSTIVGLNNLNQWPQLGPNVFYTLSSFFENRFILKPIQVAEGNFNGNATSDLMVLNPGSLTVCKDYNGAGCAASFSPLKFYTEGVNWHAAVGKLKNGKDTIAVITQNGAGSSGKLMVYETDAAGDVQNPYYNQPIPVGAPFSLAIGDYDGDAKQDIAVATRLHTPSGSLSVQIYVYRNNGASFDAPVARADFKYNQCYTPTGLASYDPDGDSKSDLVVTCFDVLKSLPECPAARLTLTCSVSYDTGAVHIMKNMGDSFVLQHTISDGIFYPYSSAVGKLNEDALFDVAVANWREKAISIYAGIENFKTEVLGKHYASSFNPKYIQIADKNSDALLDVIAVATPDLDLNRFHGGLKKIKYSSINTSDLVQIKESDYPLFYSDETIPPVYIRESADRLVMDAGMASRYRSIEYRPILLSETALSDSDTMARKAAAPDRVRSSDAVLVLINYRPQVSFDPVDCSTTRAVAHCIASPGHTIHPDACVFSSADIPAGVANVQKTVNGTGVDLTFTIPQEERDYTVTVTSTDEAGAMATQTLVVKRQGCTPPLTSVSCPAQKAHFEVWVDDPFQLCVPMPTVTTAAGVSAAASSAYSVDFSQSSGPNMFIAGAANPAMAMQATVSGNCMSGRFSFPDADIDVKGTYKIKNNLTGEVAAECPWEGKVRAALISGSGMSSGKCSLTYGAVSGMEAFSILSLFSTVLGGMFVFRRKKYS